MTIRASEILARVPTMKAIAHDPRNWLDCTCNPPESIYQRGGWVPDPANPDGEWVPSSLHDHLRFTVKEGEHWETQLIFCYSVDQVVLPSGPANLAHLSIQMSVPKHLTRGELNLEHSRFMEAFEPLLKAWFPLAPALAQRAEASDPIPVSRQGEGNVVFRTPVVFHFFADHDDPNRLFVEESRKRKVRLYGPNGQPL